MALSCTKDFSLTVSSPTVDMPLDQAIYHAANDAIYAVRGGIIFKLNASTGALISQAKFAKVGLSFSHLAHDTGQDKLWATIWQDPGIYEYSETRNKRLFDISPTDLTITQAYDLQAVGADVAYDSYNKGVHNIAYGNGLIHVDTYSGSTRRVNSYNPAAIAFSNVLELSSISTEWTDLAWDTTSNEIWCTKPHLNRIDGSVTGAVTGFVAHNPYGVCHCPANDKLYTCGVTQLVYHATKASITGWIDTTRANANPFHIRYNPNDGLIYCPLYFDDTVAVIDPATDTLSEIKTGFDFPWDMVFTPTKVWAVQHGNEGLKEVV